MRRYTLNELVEYAFLQRRGKAFYGWSREDITNAFIEGLENGTLLYSIDSNGAINGVVHAHRFDNTLFICNILTTGKGVLAMFVRRFKMMFPGYSLEAERRHRRVQYNTPRLVQLLTKS